MLTAGSQRGGSSSQMFGCSQKHRYISQSTRKENRWRYVSFNHIFSGLSSFKVSRGNRHSLGIISHIYKEKYGSNEGSKHSLAHLDEV